MAGKKSGSKSGPQSTGAVVPKRDENGRLLPGASLNPGGRTKSQREFEKAMREKCREHLEDALAVVVSILNDREEKADLRLRAAEFIWDRALGKPKQAVEIKDDEGRSQLMVAWMPENAKKAMGGGDE